jgi:hypothetical protein
MQTKFSDAAWMVLGFSWLALGLYAVGAAARLDWVAAMLGIPAIGLMVLWGREEHARRTRSEQQRIARGVPRPYDLNDTYKPRPSTTARPRKHLIQDTPGDDFESWLAHRGQS